MSTPVIAPLIPSRKSRVWDTAAFLITLTVGIIAIASYAQNRETNKMQRELIELSLAEKRQQMGIAQK